MKFVISFEKGVKINCKVRKFRVMFSFVTALNRRTLKIIGSFFQPLSPFFQQSEKGSMSFYLT